MNDAQKEQLRITWSRFQKRQEVLWSPRINQAIQQQIKEFIEQHGISSSALGGWINFAPMYEVLKDLYTDVGVKWGAKTLAYLKREPRTEKRMPIGFSEEMIREILAYFSIDLLSDVVEISETTRKNIIDALTKATELGYGIEDTIKLITDPTITRMRARLIARTETVTAANKAADISARKTGLVLQKTWIAAKDNRTRHDHRNVDGTTLDVDTPFNVGGYEMMQPGDRGTKGNPTPAKEICNCRCTVGYRGKRDANGRLLRQS